MGPDIFFLGIFVIGFLFILIFVVPIARKATLDKLESLPGEKTLFEEEDITVLFESKRGYFLLSMSYTPLSRSYAPNAVIRVTNKRIIIAQKALFKKKPYVLRYVVNHQGETKPAQLIDFMGGFVAKGGYMTFDVAKQEIALTKRKDKDDVVIPVTTEKKRAIMSLGEVKLHIFTKKPAEFMKAVTA